MIVNLEDETITLELNPATQLCPEDEDPVLALTKDGRVVIARYIAEEDGDYWANTSIDDSDSFFCLSQVTHWAYLK